MQIPCRNFTQFQTQSLLSFSILACTAISLPCAAQSLPSRNPDPVRSEISATQNAAQVDTAYTLGAGDRIQVDIFDMPEYSGENGRYQVLVDGSLNLPLLGNVPVQGMTLKQLADHLTTKYDYFLKRSIVTVTLLNPRPLNVGVAGEVVRPGTYTIPLIAQEGQTQLPYPTLTSVLKLAGGIAQSADIRQIQIHRSQRSGPEQIIQVDLWEFLQTGNLRYDPTLRDGDAIVVPTASTVSAAEMTQLAAANFSPDTIQVNVVGEVRQPGSIKVPPNSPLNTALLAAGGFDKRASKRSVELIRLNPNGTVSRRTVAINFAQGVNESTNPALRNNDVIVVRRSGLASLSDAVGAALGPFGSVFSVLNLLIR